MVVHQFGRSVQIKALPIGIPYQRFEDLARTAPKVLPTDVKVRNFNLYDTVPQAEI